jgi:hypothetical protein
MLSPPRRRACDRRQHASFSRTALPSRVAIRMPRPTRRRLGAHSRKNAQTHSFRRVRALETSGGMGGRDTRATVAHLQAAQDSATIGNPSSSSRLRMNTRLHGELYRSPSWVSDRHPSERCCRRARLSTPDCGEPAQPSAPASSHIASLSPVSTPPWNSTPQAGERTNESSRSRNIALLQSRAPSNRARMTPRGSMTHVSG